MTTKITLTNIDSTGDYSELVDAAYNTANAASSYANAAFAQANNSTDTWVRSAANSASSYANSAYAAANTKLDSSGGTISGNITITGNIVPTTANTYYLGSEASPFHSLFVGSGSISIGGLVLSNSNGSLGVTSPTGPSLDFTAISSTANAAYTQANTATTNAATADQRAVTSGDYANSAYSTANSAGVYANAAFAKANTLETTGVTAGSYTLTNITVDTYGRVTTASNTSTTGTGSVVALANSPSFTTLVSTGTREVKATISASDIDLSVANYFSKTISGTTTFTVSNFPSSGTAISFILDLTNGGSASITWWSGVKWVGGTAPTLTASGRDAIGFFTYDAGTTWTGLVLGLDIK